MVFLETLIKGLGKVLETLTLTLKLNLSLSPTMIYGH